MSARLLSAISMTSSNMEATFSSRTLVAGKPARNCRPVWHPVVCTHGAKAFAVGKSFADRVNDLVTVIGRTVLGLFLGLRADEQSLFRFYSSLVA